MEDYSMAMETSQETLETLQENIKTAQRRDEDFRSSTGRQGNRNTRGRQKKALQEDYSLRNTTGRS